MENVWIQVDLHPGDMAERRRVQGGAEVDAWVYAVHALSAYVVPTLGLRTFSMMCYDIQPYLRYDRSGMRPKTFTRPKCAHTTPTFLPLHNSPRVDRPRVSGDVRPCVPGEDLATVVVGPKFSQLIIRVGRKERKTRRWC